MIQHIHIFGATGSGTTSHGKALAENLGYVHFDNDNFFFESNNNQFTKPRRPLIRDTMLYNDLKNTPSWVLSGSICDWGDFVINFFDLVVFLWVPSEARMRRIDAREVALGRKIENPTHPSYKTYKKFIKWASEYDTGEAKMRSLAQHEEWMKKLSCPIVKIEGDKSLDENLTAIMRHIKTIDNKEK